VLWGAWQAVLPDLAGNYDLSSGPLGAMLTAGFAVALPAMLLTGRLVDRFGIAWGIGVPALAMALGLMLIGSLPPVPLLVIGVMLFSSGSGGFDVAINGAAMGDAVWRGPSRLTLLHAGFSGGGVLGAVGGGALIGAGIDFQIVYPLVAVAVLGAVAMTASSRWSNASTGESVPPAIALAMLPLAALAGLAFLAEGSMETWSAIYLRDVLGAGAFVGALGPGAFHAAMLAGRLIGAGVAGSVGAATTLLVAGSMTVVGMAVALVVPVPLLALPGMALAALGASFVVPVVVSLAAGRAGRHAGRAASYVLTLGYAGFLVGPSLVGMLGELAGLRVALAVVPVAALVIAAASRTRVATR
jgi:MFS family permease